MTTPNQPAPSYGPGYDDYAYTVGGGPWQFGSTLTEDDIAMIIHGPRGTLDNARPLLQDKFLQLPLEVLRLFQGFIPGSTMDDDFPDVPVAVSTIMQWIDQVPLNINWDEFNQWLEDTFQPVVDWVQDLIDKIIQGFNAWFDQMGFDTLDVREFSNTVGSAIGTIGTLGLRLQKIENANAKILEDFSTYEASVPSLGPKWTQWYTGSGGGTLGIVNKFAVVTLALDTANKQMYAIHKTELPSDAQKVSATVSTPASVFGDSENLLIARAENRVGGDMLFAGLTAGRVRIGCVRAGQVTVFGSKPFQFRNGSVYTFDCSDPRTFVLFENSTEIYRAVDAGGVSSVGPLFRFTGFGAVCPNGLARPGVVGSFAVYTQ